MTTRRPRRSGVGPVAMWFDVQIAGDGVRLIGEGSSGYSFFILTQGSAAEGMRQRVSARA
jgi:hypothetical protein